MGLNESCKELWRNSAPREKKAFVIACVVLFISVGLEISDQPVYEAIKPWGVLALGLLILWAILPSVVRCAGNSKYVWLVCGSSAFLLITTISIIYLSYFWAYSIEALPPGSERILTLPPVLAALWAAGMGWYVHFQAYSRNHRTTNSFNLLMQTRTSSEFLKHARRAAAVYPHGSKVKNEDAKLIDSQSLSAARAEYRDAHAQSPKDLVRVRKASDNLHRATAAEGIKYLLNYYEFMAVGIKKKDLDEDMLYHTIGNTVCSVHDRALPFIAHLRAPAPDGCGQRLAMCQLTALVARWKDRLELDKDGHG